MNKKNIITYNKKLFYIIVLGLLATIISYISGFSSLIGTIFSFLFYSLLSYLIYIIWKLITRKEKLDYIDYLDYFLYKSSIGLLVIGTIVISFVYYNNEISPVKMPTYTITNGDKTIVFQAMSHIGSQKFYNKVKNDLIEKKKEGYVYFFEGVKPGTKENHKKFDKEMGMKFDKDLYKNFSKLYGVVHQDNSIYLNLVNNKDFNVDLNLDQIMEYYKKSKIKKENNNFLKNGEVVDASKEIIKTLASLNPKELKILRYVNKGILNFMIGNDEIQNVIMDNFSNKKMFDIILNKRNEIIFNEIKNTKYKKIFITYGLLHFEGVFNLLKSNDKNWKIIKIENYNAIK